MDPPALNTSQPTDNYQQANLEEARAVPAAIKLKNASINANRDVIINVGSNYENAEKLMHTITDWLSSLNFHEVHKDVHEKITPGTATWILSNPVFLKWLNRKGEALLGTGIPGAGKTCLVSVVIEYLKSLNMSANGPVAVTYVYCRHKDQLSTSQVLASLLRQLIEHSSEVLHFVEQELYATCLKMRTTPRQSDLLKTLQGAVGMLSKVFIIVDALDELDEPVRHSIATALLSLRQSLLITTRPIPLLAFSGLELKIQAPSSDFQKLIADHIGCAPRLNWLLQYESLQNVYDKIEKKSQGMLLLAALQISSLSSGGIINLKSLETTLNALPSNLSQIYEQILERIAALNREEQSLAHRAILWVTYAARFLKVNELLEILATDLDTATFDRQLHTREEILLSVCHGLLHIEQETRTVHLTHYTAQEYLQGHNIMFPMDPHVFLADISAIYLSTRRLDLSSLASFHDLQKVRADHPFFDYAIRYLGHHTALACSISDHRLPLHVHHLLQGQVSVLLLHTIFRQEYIGHVQLIQFAAYHGLQQIFEDCISQPLVPVDSQNSALFYACLGGQATIVKQLLAQGEVDLQYCTINGVTLLHAIAEGGHTDIAQLLIWQEDNSGNTIFSGININAEMENHATALLMAAWDGHADLVQLLLGTPTINPNPKWHYDITPLFIACQNGHNLVVRYLLSTPTTDTNMKINTGATPLYIACENGHTSVVKLLSDIPKIDVNAKRDTGATPLFVACQNGHESVVQILLGISDIDANAKINIGATPLYIACENGHQSVVKLLVNTSDIDVNTKRSTGATPLHIACQNGNEPLVQLLLHTPGIDVNIKTDTGATPLFIAFQFGHESVMKQLLGMPGIEPNAMVEGGYTPLYMACQNGHQSMVKLLLDTPGIDVNVKTSTDATPLSVACWRGHVSVVKLLLTSPRIDVNAKSNLSTTPLYIACENGHVSVVQHLLDSPGIDVNAKGTTDETALWIACRNKHEVIVQLLLDIPDIDVNALKYTSWERNPLLAACENNHVPITKLLLDHPNIDVNAGRPLSQACRMNWHVPIIKLLLDHPNIDVNAAEYTPPSETPLFFACRNGNRSIVELLLGSFSLDINAPNYNGWTPLYVASFHGHVSIVQLLLHCPGINIHAKTTYLCQGPGWFGPSRDTAIQAARRRGHDRVVALLVGSSN